MYQRTVLIVDDEPLIRMMLADALEDEGYKVIEAGSALEAIVVLEASNVDAVITDINMPGGINGIDLAQHIASCRSGVSVVVTSGGQYLSATDLPEGIKFVAKPYDLEYLIAMVSEMIALQLIRNKTFLGHYSDARNLKVVRR